MKKKLIVFLLLCGSFAMAKPRMYFQPTESIFDTHKLIIDGKVHERSFYGFKDLPEALSEDPVARKHAENYYSKIKLGTNLRFAGLGSALAYGLTATTFSGGTFWALLLGGHFAGCVLYSQGVNEFVKATNQYNGVKEDLVTEQSKDVEYMLHQSLL